MNNDNYETTDLGLAAALAIFYPIDSIDKRNPQRVTFCFHRTAELDLFLEQYWKGNIKVNPQQYFSELRILKTRIRG